MAKPERHPWHYTPQWNYYPPHVFNFPKIPYPNGHGHQVSSDHRESHSIRCPEPRRPYQVPYPTYDTYCHQDNHQIHGSYVQPNPPIFQKQYVHRPIPHDNTNNPFKVCENVPSFPTCSSNFPQTKDQSNCYQTSWKNTSQCKKKTPELDVRKFLATWQEKDDDILDVSSETEETKSSLRYEPIPLDCTKRNIPEKPLKRNYESFGTGPVSNPTGCVVQPYYIKDNYVPLNRNVIPNTEMNNNIPQRNNLNYGSGNHHGYRDKNYYCHPEYWKAPNEKVISCEHSTPYSQQYNHCDVNVNSLRNNINYMRPKEIPLDTSDRSQYNLTASLETGDLFCDINSRNDDYHKQQIVHPLFNDGYQRSISCEEPPFFSNYNSDFSDSMMYNDLHPPKEPWDLLGSNPKCKDSFPNYEKHKMPVSKGPIIPHFNPPFSDTNLSNGGPITYEGAFNILPSLQDTTGLTNCVPYSNNGVIPNQIAEPPKLPEPHAMISNKTGTKFVLGSGKVKPYQFNEEISSDDIDISIASSGDLIVNNDHSGVSQISVINFSRAKKEKIINPPLKVDRNSHQIANPPKYSELVLSGNFEKSPSSISSGVNNLNPDVEVAKSSTPTIMNTNLEKDNACAPTFSPKIPSETTEQTVKSSVVDLSVLKSQNEVEVISFSDKSEIDYLDISTNYFSESNLEKNAKSLPNVENDSLSSLKKSSDALKDSLPNRECQSTESISLALPANITDEKVPNESKCDSDDTFLTNDNLLLLAHCSQEYGGQITEEIKSHQNEFSNDNSDGTESKVIVSSPSCKDVGILKHSEDKPLVVSEETGDVICQSVVMHNTVSEIDNEVIPSSPEEKHSKESPLQSKDDDPFLVDAKPQVGLSLPIIEDFAEELVCKPQVKEEVKTPPSAAEAEFKPKMTPPTNIKDNDYEMDVLEDTSGSVFNNKDSLHETETTKCLTLDVQTKPEVHKEATCEVEKLKSAEEEKPVRPTRETVIKCSLRWDKIFNVMSDEDTSQRDMSLDLGPAKVELRMPSENGSSANWRIVEPDNKIQTSSIVQVKRLILKRKSQSEERIPKMIIRKTEGQEYRSYLKNEHNEPVLNCGKFNIFYDISPTTNQLNSEETAD